MAEELPEATEPVEPVTPLEDGWVRRGSGGYVCITGGDTVLVGG